VCAVLIRRFDLAVREHNCETYLLCLLLPDHQGGGLVPLTEAHDSTGNRRQIHWCRLSC
jgi:hypothetical protein